MLDQMMLKGKQGEATAFPTLLGRVVEKYGKHFKYVTGDAGLTSAANARAVREAGKHYLFALKENFSRLHDVARIALATAPVQLKVREKARGEWVERELRVTPVPETEEFPEARQWVWVRSTREREGRLPDVETRLFLTSIPSRELSAQQLLTVVRGHWGIENGPNWTADVVLEEDTASASSRGQAPVVLSWLRLLAYNLLALVRTHLPPKEGRPVSYARCQEVLYQGLLGLAVLPETLASLAERPPALGSGLLCLHLLGFAGPSSTRSPPRDALVTSACWEHASPLPATACPRALPLQHLPFALWIRPDVVSKTN